MPNVIETETSDGKLLIELLPEYSDASLEGTIAKMPGVFDKVLDTVGICGRAFANLANHLEAESATVKFGVKLEAKSGKLFSLLAAEVGGGALFEVCVTWKRD